VRQVLGNFKGGEIQTRWGRGGEERKREEVRRKEEREKEKREMGEGRLPNGDHGTNRKGDPKKKHAVSGTSGREERRIAHKG